jgi:hypothetical protein
VSGEELFSLRTDGNTLYGNQMADGTSTEIFDGVVVGTALSRKVSITDPMPLTLTFSGSIAGDELSGTVVLGEFGNSTFLGKRLS